MPGIKSGLRNAEITTSSGKNVRDTMQIKGEAKSSAAFNAKNSMKEYSHGTTKKGATGGKPSHS